MIEEIYKFKCADCSATNEYSNKNLAKAFGWLIKGKMCYCPNCATNYKEIEITNTTNTENQISITISKKLYLIRAEKKLPLAKLADLTGLSIKTLKKIEEPYAKSKELSLENLHKICYALHYNFAKFLFCGNSRFIRILMIIISIAMAFNRKQLLKSACHSASALKRNLLKKFCGSLPNRV